MLSTRAMIAAQYYELTSNALLKVLQSPNRDTVVAATIAVILNVYETMTEIGLPRMNHIAGARALIKECGWNGQSLGRRNGKEIQLWKHGLDHDLLISFDQLKTSSSTPE